MSRATRNLCLLHLGGNALLLWAAYYWLGVGEASIPQLLWSALVALGIVCLALWLHGAALAHFGGAGERLSATLKAVLRHLPALVALALAVAGVYLLLELWQDYSSKPAFTAASYLTLKLRRPVRPEAILRVLDAALWFARWVILPVIWLPLAAALAGGGWSGLRRGLFRRSRRLLYWLEAPVLLVCALWLPLQLMRWVPDVGGFGMEIASFLVRLAAAYLLFTGGWLLLELVSSGGSPRSSQPSTAPLP
jgi:hypothetical protein